MSSSQVILAASGIRFGTLEGDDGLMAADWKDGCISELSISERHIEIDMRSVTSGAHFPRGYYCFQRTKVDD